MEIYTAQSYLQVAQSLQRSGDLAEALRYTQKALDLQPDYAEAYLEMAKIHDQSDQLDDALSCYAEALHRSEKLWEARWRLGNIYDRKGWTELALETYRQVMSTNSSAFANTEHLKLVQAFLDRYNLKAAVEYAQNSANRLESWQIIIQAAIGQQNITYAGLALQKLQELDPQINIAAECTQLGQLCLQQGKTNEAFVFLQRAIVLQPNLKHAHFYLAMTFAKIGNIRDAFLVFHEALSIDPNFAEAYYELGILACQIEKWEESLAFFDAARSLNADIYPQSQNYINQAQQQFLENK